MGSRPADSVTSRDQLIDILVRPRPRNVVENLNRSVRIIVGWLGNEFRDGQVLIGIGGVKGRVGLDEVPFAATVEDKWRRSAT